MRTALFPAIVALPLLSGCGLVLDWDKYEAGGSPGGATSAGGGGQGGGGGGEINPCGTCPEDEICESIEDGSYRCLPPVIVAGTITSIPYLNPAGAKPLSAARVVLIESFYRRAIAPAAYSLPDGTFEVKVPVTRDINGLPQDKEFTLVIDAQGHFRSPRWPEVEVTYNVKNADAASGVPVLDIGGYNLYAHAGSSGISVRGRVKAKDAPGAIVGLRYYPGQEIYQAAVADLLGDYVLYNTLPGTYDVQAFARGLQTAPRTQEVGEMHVTGVDLEEGGPAIGSVTGTFAGIDSSMQDVRLMLGGSSVTQFDQGLWVPGLFIQEGPSFELKEVPSGVYEVAVSLHVDSVQRDPVTPRIYVTVDGGVVDTGPIPLVYAVGVYAPQSGSEIMCNAGAMTQIGVIVDKSDTALSYRISAYDPAGTEVGSAMFSMPPDNSVEVPFSGNFYPGVAYGLYVEFMNSDGSVNTSELYNPVFRCAKQ